MNTLTFTGSIIVTLALISYTVAILVEFKKKSITKALLFFFTAGIILDVTATSFMIAGSSSSPFTLHGLLGYSSLAAMILDTTLFWRTKIKFDFLYPIPHKLNTYSIIAYVWWVLAYITGAYLAMR